MNSSSLAIGHRRAHCDDAFSLVEIVLAIGIISFAFVAIMGLLPVGISTFRQAMDTSVTSQIAQRVVNEAQQTDFSTLTTGTSPWRYFDDQGTEVITSGSSIYTVQVTVTAPTALPNVATSSPSLATVLVKIASNPGHAASPFDAPSKLPVSTYSAWIAKNQ